MVNLTLQETISGISQTCVNWCKDAYEIHRSNLDIQELGMIGVIILSIVINRAIYTNSEYILSKADITESALDKLHTATYYFAFSLLILFLIYNIYFK